jgi:hypothetical protein
MRSLVSNATGRADIKHWSTGQSSHHLLSDSSKCVVLIELNENITKQDSLRT